MKDTIYTIPVTEVYETPCECPLCALEARFENDRVNYYLGPSLMEPENRIATNDTGFCGKHFGMMYKTQTNRLGLGLIVFQGRAAITAVLGIIRHGLPAKLTIHGNSPFVWCYSDCSTTARKMHVKKA